MTTHITKTWFDGEKIVTQEIPESEVYKQEPVAWGLMDDHGEVYDCVAPSEHARYEGRYTVPLYTTPPAAQRLDGYRELAQRSNAAESVNAQLLEALEEAADDIEAWGAYATEYFQKRHNLQGAVNKARAAIAAAKDSNAA